MLQVKSGQYPSTTINEEELKNTCKMSFMIFRTGSVLIVGKCSENILYEIYRFIRVILETEYLLIVTAIITQDMLDATNATKQKRSIRKRIMTVSTS